MILRTPYSKKKVIDILRDQVGRPPSLFRCLISLNASRYVGTSRVCGTIFGDTFELKNRKDPFLSLKAKGVVFEDEEGTGVVLNWSKQRLSSIFFFKKHDYDREVIMQFLKEWVKTKEVNSKK